MMGGIIPWRYLAGRQAGSQAVRPYLRFHVLPPMEAMSMFPFISVMFEFILRLLVSGLCNECVWF